jgi:hypothetical protein
MKLIKLTQGKKAIIDNEALRKIRKEVKNETSKS